MKNDYLEWLSTWPEGSLEVLIRAFTGRLERTDSTAIRGIDPTYFSVLRDEIMRLLADAERSPDARTKLVDLHRAIFELYEKRLPENLVSTAAH